MKVGIITFTEGANYGNKLQNYALLKYLEDTFACDVKTVNNCIVQGSYLSKIRILLTWLIPSKKHYKYWKKLIRFKRFNKKYLKFTSEKLTQKSKCFTEVDCFVCGSDQIWNPNYYDKIDLLTGNLPIPKKSISYAASFGVDEIPNDKKKSFSQALMNLDTVSVREQQAIEICKELGRSDCVVSIDPTFLLTPDQWNDVIEKPSKNIPRKYVVTYFLGKVEENVNRTIYEYCEKHDCQRIDLNSVKSLEWFEITPFEFLYLIKNSEFIFTDSFHASVFSIIFGKKFLTSDRVEHGNNKMNSRIENLFSLFSCSNHKLENFQGNDEKLLLDRSEVDKTIENERQKAKEYLSKTFLIDGDN